MKLIALLLLAGIPVFAKAQASTHKKLIAVDRAFGFRDIKLESAITQHPEMVEVKGDSSGRNQNLRRFFKIPTEKLLIGSGQLESVTYYFYKGKLESITLVASGLFNAEELLAALEAKYGSARVLNTGDDGTTLIAPHDWKGNLAEVYYEGFAKYSKKAFVTISSIKLEKLEQADRTRRLTRDL